jgi:hypothetical protein
MARQVRRRARERLLCAFARRALWRLGAGPMPPPETLALAEQLDRLRRRCPAWWCRMDLQAELKRVRRERDARLAGGKSE